MSMQTAKPTVSMQGARGSYGRRQPENFQALLEGQQDLICRFHKHELQAHQCGSILLQQIKAPVETVWSVLRRFDKPQVRNTPCFLPYTRNSMAYKRHRWYTQIRLLDCFPSLKMDVGFSKNKRVAIHLSRKSIWFVSMFDNHSGSLQLCSCEE